MYNILICDDERDIVSALKIYLESEGLKTFSAYNGKEALKCIEENEVHLILMDVMMPVMDGITATVKIREKCNIPIIMLTAKSEDTDKIIGLNLGADDYITKPFNPVEVQARVRSQLRRYLQLGGNTPVPSKDLLVHGDIVINDRSKVVTLYGEPISLTPIEYDILKLFVQNPGKVMSPNDIYREVWKNSPLGAKNTVPVHIHHIREKIEINPAEPRYLKVVWAQGYKLDGGSPT